MKHLLSVSICIIPLAVSAWLSLASAQTSGEQSAVDAVWQEAGRLEAEGKFEEAAALYAAVPATSPAWQRAAVQAAGCLEKAGKLAEAVAGYDAAIAANPSAYWAESALFQKARTCKAQGNAAEAQRCIDRIKTRFPDSSSLADAYLLEAQMAGGDTAAAEAFVAREQEATALYKQALQADRNKDEAGALRLLETVVDQYAGIPAALRCRDARAHILVRHKGAEERTVAGAEFLHILALVADTAPNSRIAETARIRLAALHHSFENRQDAITAYQTLVNSEDKAIASRAALQLAGLQFELMQRDTISTGPLADGRWDDLRALCSLVAGSPDAKPTERVRAEVMAVESFSWQKRPADALAAAEAFLARHPGDGFKQDAATVRFFGGLAARNLKDYSKALAHFRWIIIAYAGQTEIWPGMDHLPRTYCEIWQTLRATRAPADEIAQTANALLTAFPESEYAKHVRRQTEQDQRTAETIARIKAQLRRAGFKVPDKRRG